MEKEIKIQKLQESGLRELWEISYGSQTDLKWMAYNGPYFQDPILSWDEFLIKYRPKINQDNFALIMFQGRIVGSLSSHWADGKLEKWLEFGIVIYDSNDWGKSIGSQVLPVWIKQMFELYPDIQHLGFTTWSGNQGMVKLGEKAGMQLEGRIRKVRFWKNQWFDSLKYGVLRDEI